MSTLDQFIDLTRFNIGEFLGRGGFGEVFKITEKSTNNIFAAKISLNIIESYSTDEINDILREVKINASINHPSILQFIGFNPKDFQNQNRPVIITEYASNRSLQRVIDLERRALSIKGWNDTKKLITIYGVASGMSYMHLNNILHRDLKLENILVDDLLFPKIADFGLSKITNSVSINHSISGTKGTPAYLSPEIIKDQEYTSAGDVYAFGILVYEIMTAKRAFSDLSIYQIFAAVLNGDRPQIEIPLPESYCRLIHQCWATNPKERPSFADIVEELETDKFITDTVDEEDYIDYINFIKNYRATYDKNKKIIKFDDVVKNMNSINLQKVSISNCIQQFNEKRIIPLTIYENLNRDCQNLVDKASKDVESQFFVGKYLIEGTNNFPKNIEFGIKYLKLSTDGNCADAAFYLSDIYYKGMIVQQDKGKAKEYLINILKYGDSDDSRIYNNLGRMMKKENCMEEARNYFKEGAQRSNPESMYEYAMMLINDEGDDNDINDAMKYLIISKNQGYPKSIRYLIIYDQIDKSESAPPRIKHFFIMQFLKKNKITNKNIDKIVCDIRYLLNSFSNNSFEINYPSESFKMKIIKKFLSEVGVHVLISNSISAIKNLAFYECCFLEKITIPKSVTSIGNSAFSGCSKLAQIEIPASVISIGNFSFFGCSSLVQITIPPSVTSIGNHAFSDCSSLTQIIIPLSLVSIGKSAFNKCSKLIQIGVPSSEVSNRIFFFFKISKPVLQISIPNSVNLIGDSAFFGCSSLSQINISSVVTSIGDYTFSGCSKLVKVTIPKSVTSIGNHAFSDCSSLTQIDLPKSVTSIGNRAFSGCSSLTQILIPNNTNFIGDSAFNGCSKLTQIIISSSVTSIGNSVFLKCSSLTQIAIPKSVTSIGNYAFSCCSSLTKISIPKSVTSIGNYAFSHCSNLVPFKFSSSVKSIGVDIFYGCKQPKYINKIWNFFEYLSCILNIFNVFESLDGNFIFFHAFVLVS